MEISRDELERKYWSMTNRALCKELDISVPTLMIHLRKHNIPLKGSGNKLGIPKIVVTD